MTPKEIDAKRRRWAQEQISLLQTQRENLDRRIAEFQGFLNVLAASEAALDGKATSNGVGETKPSSNDSLGSYIARALKSANGSGMSVRELCEAVTRLGYASRGKSTMALKVGTEIYRLKRRGRFGIIQLGPGRFAVRQ